MAWLGTISSMLGAGIGGTALAGAIYTGSAALENNMRASAKSEIAKFINNTAINPNPQVAVVFLSHSFEIIFGTRHWSMKCLVSSIIASTFIFVITITSFSVQYWDNSVALVTKILVTAKLCRYFVPSAFVADYFSLWKARTFLHIMSINPTISKISSIVIIDIIMSLLISLLAIMVTILASHLILRTPGTLAGEKDLFISIGKMIGLARYPDVGAAIDWDILTILILAIFGYSTSMTSLWTLWVMLASAALKLAGSVNFTLRFVRWMFDIDAHPVRVLGLVAAAIVWVGSVVYGLV
jgi:hypothetical protein